MSTATAQIIYEQHVKPLTPMEELRLVALIAKEMAADAPSGEPPKRSLLELERLGAEIWQGIDAQEYVNQ